MRILSFLHRDTETFTHILIDSATRQCAVIDPVLDYDAAAGRTSTDSLQPILELITQESLRVRYIIDTHAHADHLSGAAALKAQTGGDVVIGRDIAAVQQTFKPIFNLPAEFATDGRQFDILTDEGTQLALGNLTLEAWHVPGHTPADMAYLVRDTERTAVFVGDTLFAPDVGTARCDFPRGSSRDLYDSIQRILALPEDTLLYLCHDYPGKQGRPYTATSSVAEQKRSNIHVKCGISKAEFVHMRDTRDQTLGMPRLILPSIQVNINAGRLPEPDSNGTRYLKIPLDTL